MLYVLGFVNIIIMVIINSRLIIKSSYGSYYFDQLSFLLLLLCLLCLLLFVLVLSFLRIL